MGSSLSIRRPRRKRSRLTFSKIKAAKFQKPFHSISLNETYHTVHQPEVNDEKEICQAKYMRDWTCQDIMSKNEIMECNGMTERTIFTQQLNLHNGAQIAMFQNHTSGPKIHSYTQNYDELSDNLTSLHDDNRQNNLILNDFPSRSIDNNTSPQRNMVCKSQVKLSTPNKMIEISSDSSSDDAPLQRKHVPDESDTISKNLTDSICNISISSEHEDASDDNSIYDWLSSCKTNEVHLSTMSQNKHKPKKIDCRSTVERNSKNQDHGTYLHQNNISNIINNHNDEKIRSSEKCQIDGETNIEGHETPLRDNQSFLTHRSSKTMFTPPTPQCDSPLEKEIIKTISYGSGMPVRDTKTVTRKKACLPKTKPDAKKGNWLTNRCVVNNYILLNQLGKGSYGEVRLCKDKASNRLYAIKIMNRDILNKKTVCEKVINHTHHCML